MPEFPPPIDPSYTPRTTLTKHPAATTPLPELLSTLTRDGGLILTDLVSPTDLAAINAELEPYIQQSKTSSHEAYDLIPSQTVMVPGVVGKSDTMARIAELDVIDKLRTAVLERRCTATWEDRVEEF
ncbi:MAG: hypothetical protein Q9191_008480, partial [Dirinaria sp. TL-2023a]